MRVDIKQYPVARISTGGGSATPFSTVHCYAVVRVLRQEGPFVEFQGFSLPNYQSPAAAAQEREIDVWAMNENSSLLYRFPFCEEQRIFLGSPCCEHISIGYELEDREECIQHLLKKGDANEILDHTVSWYQELPGYREGQLQVIPRRQVMACNNWDIDFPAVVQEPLS